MSNPAEGGWTDADTPARDAIREAAATITRAVVAAKRVVRR